MPHSDMSTPSYSSCSLTRIPMTALRMPQTIRLVDKYPDEYGGGANQLAAEGSTTIVGQRVGDRHQHQAQETHHTVH